GNTAAFGAADLAAAGAQIADDVAGILSRGDDFHPHDRLEDPGIGLLQRLPEAGTAGELARENRGAHVVVAAVGEDELHVDDGEAEENTGTHDGPDALLHARDILLRHVAADDFRDELVALAGLVRLDPELDAGELARTAGLLLVRVVVLHLAGDGL